MSNIQTIIAVAIAVLLGYLLLANAEANEEELNRVGVCVDRMAQEQGFIGSPEEEWELFADNCAQ